MAEVLLFHHAQGLTPGVVAFADELRAAGHAVHTPDLFDGRTFDSIDEGMAFINEAGIDDVRERGVRTADDLPDELVYAGFSFGEMVAQQLAQTRPGARGALLFYSCIPISGEWAFGPLAGRRAGPDPRRRRRSDTSSAKATSTRPARSSSRSRTRSSSCTPATSTTSPTARSRRTTRTPPRCSPGACLRSWTASEAPRRRFGRLDGGLTCGT